MADLRTLTATGASTSTRRMITAATAGYAKAVPPQGATRRVVLADAAAAAPADTELLSW